jgi:type II secretion system protein G
MKKNTGFTLIELLIVVAIIAILAAIAIPNFLAAQTRSKVSRTKADMKTVATAIESYYVDYNQYPLVSGEHIPAIFPGYCMPPEITTPIAYLASFPKDPFGEMAGYDAYKQWGNTQDYFYCREEYFIKNGWGWAVYPNGGTTGTAAKWALESKGPDHAWAQNDGCQSGEMAMPYVWAYDPSNGTVSRGNIVVSGP